MSLFHFEVPVLMAKIELYLRLSLHPDVKSLDINLRDLVLDTKRQISERVVSHNARTRLVHVMFKRFV